MSDCLPFFNWRLSQVNIQHCVNCGKHSTNHPFCFLARHRHPGCQSTRKCAKYLIDAKQCDCGYCCSCLRRPKNQPEVLEGFLYFLCRYCHDKAELDLEPGILYRYCVLCPNFQTCPSCHHRNQNPTTYHSKFQSITLTCQSCQHRFEPRKGNLRQLY